LVGAEQIERSERVLQMIYGVSMNDAPRQMRNLEIDGDAFETFLQHRIGTLRQHHDRAWKAMDPRIEPAINTLLFHFFLVGVLCGRAEAKGDVQ
jgi:hypothetical protein